MKNFKFLILTLTLITFFSSCIDDDNDELTGDAITGGLVSLNNAAIGYVVGNDGTYTASGKVYQGRVQTNSINVYKQFTDSKSGKSSNEELFTTIPVTNTSVGSNADFAFSFTYEDLIEGLTIDGTSLPSDDTSLNIGDFWTLRYEALTSEGATNINGNITKVSVGTRYAGVYRAIDALYCRIGVCGTDEGSWPDETIIESVDAVTYRVVDYFGLFSGNTFYFQILDSSTGKITYPDETPDGSGQLGNGQPFITCQSNPNDMVNVPCDPDSNFVENDDVNGADRLYMTFGYFTAGSGPREFYQVLEKVVN